MSSFSFLGEESARFTRFAKVCCLRGVPVRVVAMGREPLSSRPVTISGAVVDATLDGYVRNVTIQDPRTALRTKVGGSNATSSIAAKSVVFEVADFDAASLAQWGRQSATYIPRLTIDGAFDLFGTFEEITNHPTRDGVLKVCDYLAAKDPAVALEAALTLRSFTGFINSFPRLQLVVEGRMIAAAREATERDIRVALIEDLGYLGGDSCKESLVQFVDDASDEQSAWAATIALGRLPGTDVLEPLLRAARLENRNARAAALLSLSRRTDRSNRATLEPLFAEQLDAPSLEMFVRYGCLGLSRFDDLHNSTWERLLAIFGDGELPLSSRGYAALAIAGAFGAAPQGTRQKILGILPGFARVLTPPVQDYPSVWALEYVSELASIVEQSDVAGRLYGVLSSLFEDWRAPYYGAMRAYELGEGMAREGDGMTAVFLFQEAATRLKSIATPMPDDAGAMVEFRRNVITIRLRIQAALGDWYETHDAGNLDTLRSAFQEIRASLQGYARGGISLGAERRLVAREVEYIRGLTELISVIENLVYLDGIMHSPTLVDASRTSARQVCALAKETVGRICEVCRFPYALALQRLLSELDATVREIEKILDASTLTISEQAPLVRQRLAKARDTLRISAWPMPGRACPVRGLGRAMLGVRKAELQGSGTPDDPFILPDRSKLSLPVYVRVVEMAPGGNTRLLVKETVGAQSIVLDVPIVEDEYPIPISLVGVDLTYRQPVHVAAHFESRDCTQAADERTFYVVSAR